MVTPIQLFAFGVLAAIVIAMVRGIEKAAQPLRGQRIGWDRPDLLVFDDLEQP